MRSRRSKLLAATLAAAMVISSAVPVQAEIKRVDGEGESSPYILITGSDLSSTNNGNVTEGYGFKIFRPSNLKEGDFHVGDPIEEISYLTYPSDREKIYAENDVVPEDGDNDFITAKETSIIVPGKQALTLNYVTMKVVKNTSDELYLDDNSAEEASTELSVTGGYYNDDYRITKITGAKCDFDPSEGDVLEPEDITVYASAAYFNGLNGTDAEYNTETFDVELENENSDIYDGHYGWGQSKFDIVSPKPLTAGKNEVEIKITHDNCTENYTNDDQEFTYKFTVDVEADDDGGSNGGSGSVSPNSNGYTSTQNEHLTFGTEHTVIKEAKTKKGDSVSLDMALYSADAVVWNGQAGKFSKKADKRNALPIDIDKSTVSVNGTKVDISKVTIKNANGAYVSQNSVFATSITKENLASYKKVEDKGKKLPNYYIQLKADKSASKDVKKAVKTANKYLKENPVYFEIAPVQIAYDTLTATLNKKGDKVRKLTSAAAGKAKKLKAKKEYTAEIKDGYITITGVGNFNGTKKLTTSSK